MQSFFRLSIGLLLFSLFVGSAFAAKDPVYTSRFNNTAVSGYDVVAYFTLSQAVKGDKTISTQWNGAKWQFSSEENLALFLSNPEKYAPEFGGYCAYAASQNKAVSVDPEVWEIYKGKLYLNYSKSVHKRWVKDKDNFIVQANQNWPALLD